MNATLKDNILFGLPIDEEYYNRVLQACALLPDIAILPAGDQTEIGERGINLSGGQKQRVSIARAVYSRSAIYLFDNSISAVDAHVGKHIFEGVIGPKGLLKHTARVFVTHAIHCLPKCDHILLLKGGRVSESGSFTQLMATAGEFKKLIDTFSSNLQREDSTETHHRQPSKEGVRFSSSSFLYFLFCVGFLNSAIDSHCDRTRT